MHAHQHKRTSVRDVSLTTRPVPSIIREIRRFREADSFFATRVSFRRALETGAWAHTLPRSRTTAIHHHRFHSRENSRVSIFLFFLFFWCTSFVAIQVASLLSFEKLRTFQRVWNTGIHFKRIFRGKRFSKTCNNCINVKCKKG